LQECCYFAMLYKARLFVHISDKGGKCMHQRGGVGSGGITNYNDGFGLLWYSMCKMESRMDDYPKTWTSLSIQAFFFFSLSFLRQSKQAKTKKKRSKSRGVCKSYDAYWFRGTGRTKKLKDRRFEPRSPSFISQRGVKGLQVWICGLWGKERQLGSNPRYNNTNSLSLL